MLLVKNHFVFLLLFLGLSCFARQPAGYVNAFIGNDGGQTYPGAVCPMGMVSASPFWSYPARKKSTKITGFGQIHMSGTGCGDAWGGPSIMPFSGSFKGNTRKLSSPYSQEEAIPGYYSVFLTAFNVNVAASATIRSTIYEFTFNDNSQHEVVIDFTKHMNDKFEASYLHIVSAKQAEGYMSEGGFCTGQQALHKIYFVVKFDNSSLSQNLFANNEFVKGNELLDKNIGASFSFNKTTKILARIGISYVSIANARENLEIEQQQRSLAELKKAAFTRWNHLLKRVEVEGGNDSLKSILYTGLYHALVNPFTYSDVNGDYLTQKTHQVKKSLFTRYSGLSLWDTYRNVSSLLTTLYPEYQKDIVSSMLAMYQESGWLPKWEHAGIETYNMNGDPAVAYISDAIVKGLKGIDLNLAYQAMKNNATKADTVHNERIRPGLEIYSQYGGWIPNDLSGETQFDYYSHHYSTVKRPKSPVWGSVSTTLEYNIADFGLAQVAKQLNKTDDYTYFLNRSKGFLKLLNPEYNLLCPRNSDGTWHKPFDPTAVLGFGQNGGYVEGNAWQYSFFAPQGIDELKKAMGGDKQFTDKLQALFDHNYYSASNEPDINFPFLFNYVKGQEWRTQKTVKKLLLENYKNNEKGIPGEEDCGTMSTWAVYALLGFYPVCPGSAEYALFVPSFKKVILHLPDSMQFSISCSKEPGINSTIQSLKMNHQDYNSYFLNHFDLMKNNELELTVK